MRSVLAVVAVVGVVGSSSVAWARPGFYVGLSAGGTAVSGADVPWSSIGADEQGLRLGVDPSTPATSTEVSGSAAARITLGFNILGYAAIEASVTGHGTDLFDSDVRQGGGHGHIGVRGYPLWHWQAKLPGYLQPLEPSLFLGWGYSIEGYTPSWHDDPFGYSKVGSWRMGLGLEYFVIDYFKVTLDYQAIVASYDNFIYNFDESLNYPMDPSASTTYHQVLAGIAFQFGPPQEQVRYGTEREESVEPAPTPHAAEPAAPAPIEPAPASTVIDG